MAYSDKVIDHYERPRNVGTLDKDAENVGTGVVGAPECGDVMKAADPGQRQDRRDRGRQVLRPSAAARAIASSSLATEWMKGQTLDQAEAIKNTDIVQELSLPPVKIHCSVLAEDAIRAAIKDYRQKHGLAEEQDHDHGDPHANRAGSTLEGQAALAQPKS